jgi:hypothetical protein
MGLLHRFDVRQHPRFVEERWKGAVETEEDLKFSVRIRGRPVRLFACRGFRAEVKVHRSVRIDLQSLRRPRSWTGFRRQPLDGRTTNIPMRRLSTRVAVAVRHGATKRMCPVPEQELSPSGRGARPQRLSTNGGRSHGPSQIENIPVAVAILLPNLDFLLHAIGK